MTSQTTSQFARPRIDARALLGLYDPADTTDWGPIRAAQLHAGSTLALFMLAANVVGATLITLLLAPLVPLWQLASWGALVAAVSAAVAFRRLSKRHRIAVSGSLRDVRDTLLDGIALGAVWSIPPLAFGHLADANAVLGLWIVLSLLMTASAVAMAALPLATIAFVTIVGASIFTELFLAASPTLAAAAGLFTVLLAMTTFSRGKSLVVIRANEIAIAERDETVSLLLRESEEDKGADWLWEIDAQRRVARANPRFAVAVGVDPKAINGMPFLQVLAGPTWEAGNFAAGLRELAERLKCREAFRDLLLPVYVNDEERWWEMSASPRYDESGVFIGFRGVGSDVTEARKSADKINRMARFDTLTGLPNRLLIHETLALAMAEAEKWGSRCAFMMIDLDRFKAVNDTLGHPVGDRLLGRVSERLKQLMTDNEMIGRLGGDEFAVVVRDATDTAKIERLARTIIDALSKPYEVDQHTLYIGASVGLATGPRDGRTAETLIRSADLALYRSKDAGGGTYHSYEPQLHMAAEERRVLEIALRSAVQNGEMHLNYQPVVDAGTGTLRGFGGAAALGPPGDGQHLPRQVRAAGRGSAADRADRRMGAAHRLPRGRALGLPVRVAVNVSAEQLHNPAFVGVVAQALAQSGLPADRLELEVTESVFMHEGTMAIQVLGEDPRSRHPPQPRRFRHGYSSLGYLSRTRFSSIQDRPQLRPGRVQGRQGGDRDHPRVVALAESLGMATTAEGVETEEEHHMVQRLGCTKVQGYYFGRPLPVDEARGAGDAPARGERGGLRVRSRFQLR